MLAVFVCYNFAMTTDILIEGFLFYKSSPQKKRAIMKVFEIDETEFNNALSVLKERLQTGAITIIETDDEVQLATKVQLAPVIESIRKNELKADIGKAGAETLAIVLYRGPISRAEIDRVRGVNSSFILRNLLIRGLVERNRNAKTNSYEFAITPALLSQLGITHKHELPDFAKISDTLDAFDEGVDKKEL